MKTDSVIRSTVAIAIGLALTTLMFTQLYRLTQTSLVYTPTKAIPIVFKPVRVNETPQPPAQHEKPKLEIVQIAGPDLHIVDTHITTKTTEPFRPGIVAKIDRGLMGPGITAGTDHDTNPLVRVSPTYPTNAQMRGTEGWVQVRFNIDANGTVKDVQVVASQPSGVFEKATISAVTAWRYSPKIDNGVAVERRGLETVLRFELPKN